MPLRHSRMKDSKGRPRSFVMMVSAKTNAAQYIIFFQELVSRDSITKRYVQKKDALDQSR